MGSNQSEKDLQKMESSEDWTILSSFDEDFSKMEENLDSQSDIDIINEDEAVEVNQANLDSISITSQLSNLDLVRLESLDRPSLRFRQANPSTEDLSETSSLAYRDELTTDVDLSQGARAYFHTPNSRVNLKLNLSLALVLTAVIGLGIGNYIGWSTNWSKKQLSLNHINKLKSLQDELLACMQKQANENLFQSQNVLKVCYENADYWKSEFEKLFQENKGLKVILEETQKHFWSNGHYQNSFENLKCNKIDKLITEDYLKEFYKLKLDFLVKQMEHLQVLKTFEEVKYQEQLSQQKLKQLEIENSELKAKLLEENFNDVDRKKEKNFKDCKKVKSHSLKQFFDDEALTINHKTISLLETKIKQLENKNNELKDALRQLQNQMELADDASFNQEKLIILNKEKSSIENSSEDDPANPLKIDLLRERINSMVRENEDLKTLIGRLRWSNKQTEDPVYSSFSFSSSSSSLLQSSASNSTFSSSDSSKNLNISVLEKEIQKLTQLLIGERNEARKWKILYKISKHNKKAEFNNEKNINEEIKKRKIIDVDDDDDDDDEDDGEDWNLDGNVYEWVVSLNVSDILKEKFSNGAKILADAWDAISENTMKFKESMPGDLYQKVAEAQIALNHFFEGITSKYNEIQNLNISDLYDNEFTQKYLEKLADLLNSSAKKLQEAGTKLNSNQKSMESRVNKYTGKLSKIIKGMEVKWTDLRNKWEKKSESSQNKRLSSNWYFNRAELRRRRSKSTGEKLKNWIFERAKNREVQRVKGDHIEKNWYFRKDESQNVFNQ